MIEAKRPDVPETKPAVTVAEEHARALALADTYDATAAALPRGLAKWEAEAAAEALRVFVRGAA